MSISSLELLEARITPSLLTIPAVPPGGVLRIATNPDDAQNENIVVTQTGPGAFTVNDMLNGVMSDVTGVKSIVLSNDNPGINSFVFNLVGDALPGGFKAQLTRGGNNVEVHTLAGGATILGTVDFTAATGADTFEFGGPFALTVKKNFTFTGNAAGALLDVDAPVTFAASVKLVNTLAPYLSEKSRIAGTLLIDNTQLPAAAMVNVVVGLDAVKGLTYLGGEAADVLDLTAPFSGPVKFLGGAENDKLIVRSIVRGKLTADFGGANDSLRIASGGSIGGTALLGDGGDELSIEQGSLQSAKLTVSGGPGGDAFRFGTGSLVNAPLVLDGGSGGNTVEFALGSTVTALVSYRGGADADTIRLGDAQILGGLTADLGDGANSFGVFAPGNQPVISGKVDLKSGFGGLDFDTPRIGGLAAWKITLKGGTNTIKTALDASSLQILGGSGTETVTLAAGVIGSLKATLGAGDDAITFGAGIFSGANVLDGGAGSDTVTGIALYNRSLKSFETIL